MRKEEKEDGRADGRYQASKRRLILSLIDRDHIRYGLLQVKVTAGSSQRSIADNMFLSAGFNQEVVGILERAQCRQQLSASVSKCQSYSQVGRKQASDDAVTWLVKCKCCIERTHDSMNFKLYYQRGHNHHYLIVAISVICSDFSIQLHRIIEIGNNAQCGWKFLLCLVWYFGSPHALVLLVTK